MPITTHYMGWFWFFSIVGTTMFSSDPTISYITKGIILGYVFPFFKVLVVFASKRVAQSLNAAMKVDDDTARKCITEWVAGAEVCLNLSSMYGIFLSGSSYVLFLAQFVPQEAIEQATAFLSHHPWIIKQLMYMEHKISKKVQIGRAHV